MFTVSSYTTANRVVERPEIPDSFRTQFPSSRTNIPVTRTSKFSLGTNVLTFKICPALDERAVCAKEKKNEGTFDTVKILFKTETERKGTEKERKGKEKKEKKNKKNNWRRSSSKKNENFQFPTCPIRPPFTPQFPFLPKSNQYLTE